MNPLHLLLLLAVILVWGFNFVAIKVGLQGFPPIFLCFVRFLFCLPALLFFPRPPAPLKKILAYSLVMFVLQFSLLFIGMRASVSPGLASILLQFQSFFAIGLGVSFLKEKYHLKQAIGAGISLLGILIISIHTGSDVTLGGIFLVLSAAVTWATGSMLAKKMEKGSGLALVVWSSLFACPPLFALSLFLEGSDVILTSLQNFSWLQFGAVSYIAYMATLFGFGFWNWLLRYYPLSQLSSFTLLVPIVGMASSSLVLGETLHWWKIAAAALILSGLIFSTKASVPLKAENP